MIKTKLIHKVRSVMETKYMLFAGWEVTGFHHMDRPLAGK